jgi:mono/diheme cytochrome c family protein
MVTIGVLCIAGALAAAAPAAQTPVSIKLPPQSVNFREAPGVELAHKDCLTCHSAEYVLSQPALSKTAWTNEVTKMRVAYGASIPDIDSDAIIAYLVAQNPVPAK